MADRQVGHHPHVGDIRGKGMHMALEFVKDRDSNEMYPHEIDKSRQVFNACMERGLVVCPVHGDSDGMYGDSVIIKPAFTVVEGELVELFDKLKDALDAVDW